MGRWDNAVIQSVELKRKLDRFDWSGAQSLCTELIQALNASDEPFPIDPAKEILFHLRRKRQFTLMQLVADALIRNGQSHAQVRRQYAQAMIDQGDLTAPKLILQCILTDKLAPISEHAEANGLIGRIYKQLYVDANDPSSPRQQESIRQAIATYYDVYKVNPDRFLWQGINTVALLERASADGVSVSDLPSKDEIASQIDEILLQRERLEYWDRATAIENSIARNDFGQAYDHLLYYLVDPRVDAFELNSLLRQLVQVWRLTTEKEPGSTIIPALKATLLTRLGGRMDLPPGDIASESRQAAQAYENLRNVLGDLRLQAIWGEAAFQPLEWYRTGLERCAAVGRVQSTTGQKVGTGFLVRRRDFFSHGPDDLVLLTNMHVIAPDDRPVPHSVSVAAARVKFEAQGTDYKADALLWSSPYEDLDASFVKLRGVGESVHYCPLQPPAKMFLGNETQRVYVIGYPRGSDLAFSLQDSIWLERGNGRLLYQTPTDEGSSGSPVFDQDYWTLVGLHHAERTSQKANEGIDIESIKAATCQAVGVSD